MTADALFFKTDFICSSCMLPSFILRHVCLPKLPSQLCKLPRANSNLGKLKICSYVIFYPRLPKKQNPLNLNNFSCIQSNLPKTCPKNFSIVRPLEMDIFVSFRHRKKMMLNFFLCVYVLRKVRIGTILELSCARWEFSLCCAIPEW